MSFKRFFTISTIGTGVLSFIIILLLLINSKYGVCEEGHFAINETNKCFYHNDICKEGEIKDMKDDAYICIYQSVGPLNTKMTWGVLGFFLVGWFVVFILFIFLRGKKAVPLEPTFKKEDFVYPNEAKKLWALAHSKAYDIPIIDNEYKKPAFHFYSASEPFQRGKEQFLQFQCEVTEGTYQGIFTVLTSISKGKLWISNGGARWKQCTYGEYKIARDKPIYIPENIQERMVEQLMVTHPEKAVAIQEQMLKKGVPEPVSDIPSERPQQVIVKQPRVRLPWRKRYYT